MATHPTPVTIITPCYNEGSVVSSFLHNLGQTLVTLPFTFHIVVVNDGSTDDTGQVLQSFKFNTPGITMQVLDLGCNVGHQAAIYRGFQHALTGNSRHFIVMDADGEDSPAAIPALLRYLDTDIVNVVRSRRRESVLFRFCYYCYKAAFRLVTGKRMNFGNFCLISRNVVEKAVHANFTHLAAFLSRQNCTAKYIRADKEERLGGKSKMSFTKLFRHAARSFTEYGFARRMPVFKKVTIR